MREPLCRVLGLSEETLAFLFMPAPIADVAEVDGNAVGDWVGTNLQPGVETREMVLERHRLACHRLPVAVFVR
jgi:hypothetical protein